MITPPDALATQAAAGLGTDRLLTSAEVATLLGVTDRTLRNWGAKRIGPRHVRVGRKYIRYRASDVDAWLDSNADAA
jgi:excisionase family DNA binding protein